MGLAATIRNAAEAAITALDDIATTITYHSKGTVTYGPGSDGNSIEDGGVNESVSAVLTSYKSAEIDNDAILPTDQKCLIAANDITATPKNEDTITVSDVTWEVISVQKDPAEALYTLQLRKQ